jgi:hypothetical protein
MAQSDDYTPPGPALTPCAGCGMLIQARKWVHGTKGVPATKGSAGTPAEAAHWENLPENVYPGVGSPHRCGEPIPLA